MNTQVTTLPWAIFKIIPRVIAWIFWTKNKLEVKIIAPLIDYAPSRITPNRLTIFRLPFGFLTILALQYRWSITAIIFFAIACLTDLLDGPLARKRNLESAFGARLDPLADKVVNLPILAYLPYHYQLTPIFDWVVLILLMILADLFTTWAGWNNLKKGYCPKANSYGKSKFTLQSVSILLLMCTSFQWTARVILTFALIFGCFSLRGYWEEIKQESS